MQLSSTELSIERARPRSDAAPAVNSDAVVLAESGKQPTRKLVVGMAPNVAYTRGIFMDL